MVPDTFIGDRYSDRESDKQTNSESVTHKETKNFVATLLLHSKHSLLLLSLSLSTSPSLSLFVVCN